MAIQAFQASIQGHVVAENIMRKGMLSHMERISVRTGIQFNAHKLMKYPQDVSHSNTLPLIYVLSLGKYDGCLGFNGLHITGPIAAIMKFIVEYTKVLDMIETTTMTKACHLSLGKVFWKFADWFSLFLSRTIIQPPTTRTTKRTKID